MGCHTTEKVMLMLTMRAVLLGSQSSTSTGEKYSLDQTRTPFRFTVHPSIVSGISKKWKKSSLHP